jgi:hypothetical protein
MLQSFSQDDLHKIAPTIGFYPDTSDSWQYGAAATWDGIGESNNRNFGFENLYPTNWGRIFSTYADALATPAAGVPFTANGIYTTHGGDTTTFLPPSVANFGFYKRQKMIQFNPAAAPWSSLISTTNTQQLLKNYYVSYNNSGTTGYKVWYINAIIRLKDMSDFFQQIPLVKGAYLRFIINLNLATVAVTCATQATTGTDAPTQVPAGIKFTQTTTTLTNGTCPLLLASGAPGNGMDSVAVNSMTLNMSVGVANLSIAPPTGATTLRHSLNSCRLYVPLYSMSAIAEQSYLSSNKSKVVTYRDIFNYRVTGIGSGESFNQLITNGIVNPKSIVIMPFFNSDSSTGNASGFSPYQSVFSTAPATTSPLCAIGDFNIQLAGVNVMQINETYDWQNFVDETQHVHALNGGLVTGLTSGLLTEYDWSQSYRFYTLNLARRLASEDQVPKSIMFMGKNYSQRKVDYVLFVETERSITLDIN